MPVEQKQYLTVEDIVRIADAKTDLSKGNWKHYTFEMEESFTGAKSGACKVVWINGLSFLAKNISISKDELHIESPAFMTRQKIRLNQILSFAIEDLKEEKKDLRKV